MPRRTQLAPSWRIEMENHRKPSNMHGLTIDYWSGAPKVGCLALKAHYAPRDNAEIIAQFPNQVIPARLINRWLNSNGAPPC